MSSSILITPKILTDIMGFKGKRHQWEGRACWNTQSAAHIAACSVEIRHQICLSGVVLLAR